MGSVVSLHAHPARIEADRLASAAPLTIPFSAASLGAQARLLTLLGSDAPLPVLLDALARYVETWAPAMWCSILIRDPVRNVLMPGAAPSLPRAFVDEVGEVPVGENVGSCGTAASRRQPVKVPDLHDSPLWADYRGLVDRHGLRACWSVPFLDDSGEVLGTFAQYYTSPREPSPGECQLIEFAAALAKMVVLQHRRLTELWASNERVSLERAVIETAEQEREHLALDLHDGVSQRLVGIEWLIAAELARADPERAAPLRELQALVSGVQRDVGTLATWMLPLTRQHTGLAGALRELARDTRERHRVDCRATIHGEEDLMLPEGPCSQLLRIVQGATSHAIEPGNCASVAIDLEVTPRGIGLDVRVDGHALADGEPASLRAARYRARQIGAAITFEPLGATASRMRLALPQVDA
jgi:signal transduction histidine kinase